MIHNQNFLAAAALVIAVGFLTPSSAQEFEFRANTIGAPGGIQEVTLKKLEEVAEAGSNGRIWWPQ